MKSACFRARATHALLLAGCAAAAPAYASAGRLGGGGPLEVSLARIMGAILVCALIALLAALAIRQRGGKVDLGAIFSRIELKPRAVQVLETRRLSLHADICLVQHGDREYLLVLAAGHAQILRERELSAPAEGSEV